MSGQREFEVVVHGATGFTGRLVVEHLVARHRGGNLRWAISGRSAEKLEAVRREFNLGAATPSIIADASDAASLASLCARTNVVITTVGPYQLYGEPLVAACAAAGTDYVDLCGEPAWMAQMIERRHAAATRSGARIVFSCGFDSIPFDLGVVFLQDEAIRRFGHPLRRVRGRVRRMKGGASGGTIASGIATLQAAAKDPSLRKVLADPFALTPGFKGPPQPRADRPLYDEAAGSWATPFIMAAINTKNVHRTNFLLGRRFGDDFTYDEMQLTGAGPAGKRRAGQAHLAGSLAFPMLAVPPIRALLHATVLPKPGQGPTKEQRETGYFDVLFIGETADGRSLRASVKGDRDPGYGSTSKMIAETALCLARDVPKEKTPGGIWTPGAALGEALIERLQANAGLTFAIEA
jgi:short subunit dehydrogenase-like uncharacterized protein